MYGLPGPDYTSHTILYTCPTSKDLLHTNSTIWKHHIKFVSILQTIRIKRQRPKYDLRPGSDVEINTVRNASEEGVPPNVHDGVQHRYSRHHARL